jgi:hypothetical protein
VGKWRFPCKEKSKGSATFPRGSSEALACRNRECICQFELATRMERGPSFRGGERHRLMVTIHRGSIGAASSGHRNRNAIGFGEARFE